MTARGRLVTGAALLAGVLAGAVAVARFAVHEQDERALRAQEASERVLQVQPDEVVEVEIALGASSARVRREATGWRVTESGAQADPAAVGALIDRLGSLRRRSPVTPGRALAVYGLEPPRGRVTLLLGSGRTLHLDLGDDAPVGPAFYARAGGEVLVVEGSVAGVLGALAVPGR